MSSHADADAFMRKYLEQPQDATARLVFADWLDETGEAHNAAWAQFIRLKAEAGRYSHNSPERPELDRQADAYAPKIRANLTICAKLFVSYPCSFLQLLPAPNITVKLRDFEIPHAILELVPESVARENFVLPLTMEGRTFIVATPHADDTDLALKLDFILNRDIVLVCAGMEDVLEAINHHYGQSETESVVCISYESPLVGLERDQISFTLYSVFHTAFSSAATGFTMEVGASGCSVRYYADETLLSEQNYDPSVYDRLLEHLLEQQPYRNYTRTAYTCADLDVPLLSGRRFPVTLERQRGARDCRWFRLRFRW
jgi:uncharacterized protein (TIGR02996 family)